MKDFKGKKFLLACLAGLIALLGVVTVVFFRSLSSAHQARFNVDILERFIQLYKLEHGEYPQRLSDLRPIDVVSFGESLALKSQDLRGGIWRGYRYAYQRTEKDKFVLSASPAGFLLPAEIEFGITEDGFLRLNVSEVDPGPDTPEEMLEWKPLSRSEGVVTRPGR